MKKILLSIILFALFFLGIIGYKHNSYNNTTLDKITISEVTHSLFYAPFYVSIHNGYFEKNNIEVSVTLTSGADKVAASVLSGDTLIGLSGLEATLYVYQNGEKDYLINFSSLTKRDGQFLVGDCKYKDKFDINNLIGKRVLVGRKNGMPEMVFNYALYKNNLDNKKVLTDTSIDFASLSGAYIGLKEEGFVNLFEPTASMIEKEGYGCVLSSIGLMSGELPYTVFHTKKSFLENNEDLIKRFKKSIDEGLNYVNTHTSKEIALMIKKEFPNNSITELETSIKRYKESDSWWNNSNITETSYNNLLDLMEYNNALDKRVDYNKIVFTDTYE